MNITDEILYTTKLRVVNAVGSAASIEHDYVDDSLDEVVVAALQAAGPLLIAAELRAQADILTAEAEEIRHRVVVDRDSWVEDASFRAFLTGRATASGGHAARLRARADELDGGA